LPSEEMTPPVTKIYFIAGLLRRGENVECGMWNVEANKMEGRNKLPPFRRK
jgi:hypothetical protein